MPTRSIIIIATILLLFAISIKISPEYQVNNIDLPNKTITQLKKETVNIKTKDATLKTITNGDKTHTIIATVFDDDPVVDIQLIINNNRFCYRHLSNIAQTKDYLEQIRLRVSKKQFDYYQNYTKYCNNLKQEHPEFHLTNKQLLLEQNKDNKATSQWGRIINGEIDAETLSNIEIQSLLKQNDVNILNLAPKYLESYYRKIIHWDLEELLQNHQYDYVAYIRYHSHQLYICKIGADCNPNSSIMAGICYRNSNSCGLSFQEYINKVLTRGQQADIQLVLGYLKSQYQ